MIEFEGKAAAIQNWRQLVFVLETLLSEHGNLTETSRIIARLRFQLGEESNALFLPFVGIDSETDRFPLGHVRERWNAESLASIDRQRMDVEAFYLSSALEAAKALLSYARANAL